MPKTTRYQKNGVMYMTVQDLCKTLKYSERWIYKLIQQGRLKGFKKGNTWFFNPLVLKQFDSPDPLYKETTDDELAQGV